MACLAGAPALAGLIGHTPQRVRVGFLGVSCLPQRRTGVALQAMHQEADILPGLYGRSSGARTAPVDIQFTEGHLPFASTSADAFAPMSCSLGTLPGVPLFPLRRNGTQTEDEPRSATGAAFSDSSSGLPQHAGLTQHTGPPQHTGQPQHAGPPPHAAQPQNAGAWPTPTPPPGPQHGPTASASTHNANQSVFATSQLPLASSPTSRGSHGSHGAPHAPHELAPSIITSWSRPSPLHYLLTSPGHQHHHHHQQSPFSMMPQTSSDLLLAACQPLNHQATGQHLGFLGSPHAQGKAGAGFHLQHVGASHPGPPVRAPHPSPRNTHHNPALHSTFTRLPRLSQDPLSPTQSAAQQQLWQLVSNSQQRPAGAAARQAALGQPQPSLGGSSSDVAARLLGLEPSMSTEQLLMPMVTSQSELPAMQAWLDWQVSGTIDVGHRADNLRRSSTGYLANSGSFPLSTGLTGYPLTSLISASQAMPSLQEDHPSVDIGAAPSASSPEPSTPTAYCTNCTMPLSEGSQSNQGHHHNGPAFACPHCGHRPTASGPVFPAQPPPTIRTTTAGVPTANFPTTNRTTAGFPTALAAEPAAPPDEALMPNQHSVNQDMTNVWYEEKPGEGSQYSASGHAVGAGLAGRGPMSGFLPAPPPPPPPVAGPAPPDTWGGTETGAAVASGTAEPDSWGGGTETAVLPPCTAEHDIWGDMVTGTPAAGPSQPDPWGGSETGAAAALLSASAPADSWGLVSGQGAEWTPVQAEVWGTGTGRTVETAAAPQAETWGVAARPAVVASTTQLEAWDGTRTATSTTEPEVWDGTRTALVYDERMLAHSEPPSRWGREHPERPNRIVAIMQLLSSSGLLARCKQVPGRPATDSELEAVHDPELVKQVAAASAALVPKAGPEAGAEAGQGAAADSMAGEPLPSPFADSSRWIVDCPCNQFTNECARIAAGSAVDVAVAAYTRQVRNGAAIIRPPGHHAESALSMGFCIFNNAAVAARAAQKAGAQRVLIVDWDVHHGNGTAHAFHDDPSVLFCSTHRWDRGYFFPGTGGPREAGAGPGLGYTVNVAWDGPGITDADCLLAFRHVIMPIATAYRPDLVIVSAGFDAARGDPLGECLLSPALYGHLTHMVSTLAPCVLLLEGGYNLAVTAECTAECVRVLLDNQPATLDIPQPTLDAPSRAGLDAVLQTLSVHAPYWPAARHELEVLRRQQQEREEEQRRQREESPPETPDNGDLLSGLDARLLSINQLDLESESMLNGPHD